MLIISGSFLFAEAQSVVTPEEQFRCAGNALIEDLIVSIKKNITEQSDLLVAQYIQKYVIHIPPTEKEKNNIKRVRENIATGAQRMEDAVFQRMTAFCKISGQNWRDFNVVINYEKINEEGDRINQEIKNIFSLSAEKAFTGGANEVGNIGSIVEGYIRIWNAAEQLEAESIKVTALKDVLTPIDADLEKRIAAAQEEIRAGQKSLQNPFINLLIGGVIKDKIQTGKKTVLVLYDILHNLRVILGGIDPLTGQELPASYSENIFSSAQKLVEGMKTGNVGGQSFTQEDFDALFGIIDSEITGILGAGNLTLKALDDPHLNAAAKKNIKQLQNSRRELSLMLADIAKKQKELRVGKMSLELGKTRSALGIVDPGKTLEENLKAPSGVIVDVTPGTPPLAENSKKPFYYVLPPQQSISDAAKINPKIAPQDSLWYQVNNVNGITVKPIFINKDGTVQTINNGKLVIIPSKIKGTMITIEMPEGDITYDLVHSTIKISYLIDIDNAEVLSREKALAELARLKKQLPISKPQATPPYKLPKPGNLSVDPFEDAQPGNQKPSVPKQQPSMPPKIAQPPLYPSRVMQRLPDGRVIYMPLESLPNN